MPERALMYEAADSWTFAFSTDSSKLDEDTEELTDAPTFLLSFACATDTFSQTALCEFDRLAASLSSLVETELSELLNDPACSVPRLLHLPDNSVSTKELKLAAKRSN